MKKLILSISILFSLSCYAQNATMDKNGNYTAITKVSDSTAYKPINKNFTDAKGVVYPVYISDKNKLFIKKISKAGREYRFYIYTEAKQK